MKMLKIVNHHRQPLAQITWTPDNQLQLEILEAETDADFKSALTDFVNNCQHQGLPFRTGRQVQQANGTVFVDEQFTVKPDDQRFLQALGDAISRYTFGERKIRLFGLIQE
ncbi:MAG: hypothetical protein U1V55_07265 [Planktothrix rubescens PR222]|jgi:hypothetical protein